MTFNTKTIGLNIYLCKLLCMNNCGGKIYDITKKAGMYDRL